jgi:hypothetical protein
MAILFSVVRRPGEASLQLLFFPFAPQSSSVSHGRRVRSLPRAPWPAKRRFGLKPSGMTLGLDRVPESLFPAVASSAYLPLGPIDIIAIVLVFFVGALAISRIFFAVGFRDQPY